MNSKHALMLPATVDYTTIAWFMRKIDVCLGAIMVESHTMMGFMRKIDVCLGAIMVESHTMIGFMRKIDVCLGAMIHDWLHYSMEFLRKIDGCWLRAIMVWLHYDFVLVEKDCHHLPCPPAWVCPNSQGCLIQTASCPPQEDEDDFLSPPLWTKLIEI